MTPSRSMTRLQPFIGPALAALVAAAVLFLVMAPAFFAFGVAVAAAVSWCVWLERHPESKPTARGVTEAHHEGHEDS